MHSRRRATHSVYPANQKSPLSQRHPLSRLQDEFALCLLTNFPSTAAVRTRRAHRIQPDAARKTSCKQTSAQSPICRVEAASLRERDWGGGVGAAFSRAATHPPVLHSCGTGLFSSRLNCFQKHSSSISTTAAGKRDVLRTTLRANKHTINASQFRYLSPSYNSFVDPLSDILSLLKPRDLQGGKIQRRPLGEPGR